jgi:hypothetical protein
MLATCVGMMIVCMFPKAAGYSESHKTLSNSEFRQLGCTAGLHDPVVAKRGECQRLVEKQGRMPSTAQSIGRKCEIYKPPDLVEKSGPCLEFNFLGRLAIILAFILIQFPVGLCV